MAKARTMWMRLKSAAGTGYYYTIRRPKSKMGLDKMTLRKYDPVVRRHVLFIEEKK
jgi:large subunit ribosomal protein L33